MEICWMHNGLYIMHPAAPQGFIEMLQLIVNQNFCLARSTNGIRNVRRLTALHVAVWRVFEQNLTSETTGHLKTVLCVFGTEVLKLDRHMKCYWLSQLRHGNFEFIRSFRVCVCFLYRLDIFKTQCVSDRFLQMHSYNIMMIYDTLQSCRNELCFYDITKNESLHLTHLNGSILLSKSV